MVALSISRLSGRGTARFVGLPTTPYRAIVSTATWGRGALALSVPTRRVLLLRWMSSSRVSIKGMFDYKGIRDNADAYWQNIRDRNVRGADPYRVGELYDRFREITQGINGMQTELNHASKEISLAKRRKDEGSLDRGAEELTERAAALKQKIKGLHAELQEVEAQLAEEASKIPNLTHPGVPVGDESQAREIYRYGGSASREAEEVHDHYDLALGLGIADISAGARVAGSRFHYWTGAGVLLEQALVQFTLQRAIERGYVPYAVPEMARADIVGACGFRPRNTHYSSEDGGSSSSEPSQIYQVRPVAVEAHEADNAQNPLCMIATAEIPLVAYHAGRVFNYPPPDMMRPAEKGGPGQARAWMPEQGLQNEALPVRMVGVSHCFRAEAGARGRDTRGLYRLHQFTKVELVALTTRHHSDAMLEEIREVQESIFRDLGLTFRVLDMPTQELGNAAYRKYDIEAWMPGRNGWGEISSASNCTDYQSRRLGIRYRSNEVEEGEGEGKRRKHRSLQFVHTLNGTACAVPRTVVALLETHQNRDGSVTIPEVLRPWMMGKERLMPVDVSGK